MCSVSGEVLVSSKPKMFERSLFSLLRMFFCFFPVTKGVHIPGSQFNFFVRRLYMGSISEHNMWHVRLKSFLVDV